MTDQPTDPAEQTPAPDAPTSDAAAPAPEPGSPTAEPGSPPMTAPVAPPVAPPPAPPAGPPAAAPYGGPAVAPPGATAPWNPVPQPGPPGPPPMVPQAYGQPGYPQQAPPPAYGQPGQPAQPGYPPPANPYGGYAQAPAYAGGGGPAYPGSLAYVQQNFGQVADFGQRALAYLIDIALTLIGVIPAIIGGILLAVSSPGLSTDQYGNVTSAGDGNTGLAVVGGLLIFLGVVISIGIALWNRVFKMGRTGQSVGKKTVGLFLLDDKTGRPIGAGMCFLREVVQSLVNQVFYLGWLWMLWDADKQTLGDKSVHSSVVVVPKR